MSKFSYQKEESKRTAIVAVCIIGISVLGILALLDVAATAMDATQLSPIRQHIISSSQQVHYRFRAIYTGADITHTSYAGLSTVSSSVPTSHAKGVSHAHSGYYASYSAPTMSSVGAGAGALGTLQSNQSPHSYGGGGAVGGNGAAGGSSSAGSPALAVSYGGGGYVSAPAVAFARKPRMASEFTNPETPLQAIGPLRINHTDGKGTNEGDISDDDWYWDGEAWLDLSDPRTIGVTRTEGGVGYTWNGSDWVTLSDQHDPDGPIGDAPVLLLLLMLAGYVICRRNRLPED